MATVYLCIGTMKTGTSAIQKFMRKNKTELDKQGYCYPRCNVSKRNIMYRNANFLIHKPYAGEELTAEEAFEKGMLKMQQLAQKYENIVLSDELIWHYSGKIKYFWHKTRERFENIGCKVKVVVYLRRQDELVQSLWNQNVKSNERWQTSFEQFIEEKKFRYFPLDYYKKLTQIANIMGKENVIVRVYERGQFEDGDLIADFTKTLGIQLNDQFKMLDSAINLSLKGNFLEIKRMINGVPAYREKTDFLQNTLLTACSEKDKIVPIEKTSLFKYEDQVAFQSKYDKSNEKVAREFLGREDGILFYDPIKELPYYDPKNDKMLEDFIHFTVNYMCKQEEKIEALEQNLEKLKEKLKEEPPVSFSQKAYGKLKKMVKGE